MLLNMTPVTVVVLAAAAAAAAVYVRLVGPAGPARPAIFKSPCLPGKAACKHNDPWAARSRGWFLLTAWVRRDRGAFGYNGSRCGRVMPDTCGVLGGWMGCAAMQPRSMQQQHASRGAGKASRKKKNEVASLTLGSYVVGPREGGEEREKGKGETCPGP